MVETARGPSRDWQDEVVQCIVAAVSPERIILFGSRALQEDVELYRRAA